MRWNRNEEWSPWNCVLLTKDEASAHEKLVNLEEVSSNLCFSFFFTACLLDLILMSRSKIFSHVGTGLPEMNQY